MYQLINVNFLIPKITKYDTFEEALEGLQQDTILRSIKYTDKIYMLKEKEENTIYTSDGEQIYMNYSTKDNIPVKKIIYTYKKINYFENVYIQSIETQYINYDTSQETKMHLKINEKKKVNLNVKFIDENIITQQTPTSTTPSTTPSTSTNINNDNQINKQDIINEKKEEIIKMIEKVNELYQKELSKIKKLELNLKTYNFKLKKLEKTKNDNIINEIIKTQSEYRTWKKIKYGLNKDTNETDILKPISELEESGEKVPILFLSKYNYIEKIQNNESISKLLDEINQLNLNDLYSNNLLPNNNIVQFCNKYMKLSKELHYHFDDHEWSYLEHEMNFNSTNKLCSNVVSSNKI